jgi:hypothetical protein
MVQPPLLKGKQQETTMTDAARAANDEQIKLWNTVAGRAWVEARELLDDMFKPFEELLVKAVCAAAATRARPTSSRRKASI